MPAPKLAFQETSFLSTPYAFVLADKTDKVLFKISRFDQDYAELVKRFPLIAHHREQHRIVYDYAIETGALREAT